MERRRQEAACDIESMHKERNEGSSIKDLILAKIKMDVSVLQFSPVLTNVLTATI